MQTVGSFEAKTHFSALLEKVEKGEQIIITKHGRVVAKLVPATAANHLRVKNAISSLKDLSHEHTLKDDWKKLRDADGVNELCIRCFYCFVLVFC